MILAREIVSEASQRGIELYPDGEFLRFRGPKGALTDELKSRLVAHKGEILSHLRNAETAGGATPTGDSTSKNCEKSRVLSPSPLSPHENVSGDETFPNPLDLKDVLTFPVRLLGDLPLPPVLVVEVPGFDSTVVLDFRKRPDTWRSGWRRKPKARPTFELQEIEALTEATENGSVRPRDFVLWCQRKQSEPYWRLDRTTALLGKRELIRRPTEPKNWTAGRLLDALGAKLRLIKIVALGAKTAGHGPYAEATQ